MNHSLYSARPLVRLRSGSQNIALNDIALDPYFLIKAHPALQLSSLVDKEAALGCLGHRILGKPADLRAHVQRILLLIKEGERAAIYSALLDLFIILGSRGIELKQRMIQLAKPYLAPATVVFFQEHLEQGIMPDDPHVVRVKGSLLRVSHVLGVPLVERKNAHASRAVSVMEQANALLEYGQLEHAVELLENALLQDPDQESEAELLLGLYRTLQEEARWHSMCEQLQLNFNRLPAAWGSASRHF